MNPIVRQFLVFFNYNPNIKEYCFIENSCKLSNEIISCYGNGTDQQELIAEQLYFMSLSKLEQMILYKHKIISKKSYEYLQNNRC